MSMREGKSGVDICSSLQMSEVDKMKERLRTAKEKGKQGNESFCFSQWPFFG